MTGLRPTGTQLVGSRSWNLTPHQPHRVTSKRKELIVVPYTCIDQSAKPSRLKLGSFRPQLRAYP